MVAESASDCLVRAGEERALAQTATLLKVREQHLRSAERWDHLTSEVRLRAEAQALIRERGAERKSVVAAARGKNGGRQPMATTTRDERSDAAPRASEKRSHKDG